MGSGSAVVRLIFAVVAAYVLVAQAALGGFDGGRHAGMTAADPFAVLCSTLADGALDGHDAADMGACCTLGCAAVAVVPASEPETVAFAYPRPAPAPRPVAEAQEPLAAPAGAVVRRPRGPPAVS